MREESKINGAQASLRVNLCHVFRSARAVEKYLPACRVHKDVSSSPLESALYLNVLSYRVSQSVEKEVHR